MPVTDDQPEPLAKRPKTCDQRSKKCVKISMQTKIDIIQDFMKELNPHIWQSNMVSFTCNLAVKLESYKYNYDLAV